MKAVLQRVLSCGVTADGEDRGKIERGLLILLGIQSGDTEDEVHRLVNKIVNMRIFEDNRNKMNLSVNEVNGSAAIASNFTLCANVNSGRRPSFEFSEKPEKARKLYNLFCDSISEAMSGRTITGIFGADMKITLENDGPVTFIIDTREK